MKTRRAHKKAQRDSTTSVAKVQENEARTAQVSNLTKVEVREYHSDQLVIQKRDKNNL